MAGPPHRSERIQSGPTGECVGGDDDVVGILVQSRGQLFSRADQVGLQMETAALEFRADRRSFGHGPFDDQDSKERLSVHRRGEGVCGKTCGVVEWGRGGYREVSVRRVDQHPVDRDLADDVTELVGRYRFENEAVGAGRQAGIPVLFVLRGAQNYHRDGLEVWICLHGLKHVQAAALGDPVF